MPSANYPQCQFLALPHKFRAFVAGYGSGKTWVGGMAQCIHAWEHPKINQGYFAPTYSLIRDVFYPTIEEVAFEMQLRVEVRESNKEVHFYSGRQYRSTTICRSMDAPATIVGFKIGNALIDEFDVLDLKKAQDAWRKIIARMRYNQDGLRNGIDVTTTPEGFRATHKLFVAAVSEKPELAERYGIIQASTYDNEANLPEDYIPSLYETYTRELIEAYINGQFTNLASGTIYRNYNRQRCESYETIRGRDVTKAQAAEPLMIGMDFNVMHMAATVWVQRPNGLHAVAELKDVFDTPSIIKIINERWKTKGHRIIIYPDATAKNRESIDASRSDISLLEAEGYEIRKNNSNGSIKDRINATNKQFEIGHLHVNSRECPTVVKCLEGQIYDSNGEPDKTGGFDHQNDATTYPISYEFPIDHNRVHRIKIGGV